MKDLRIIFMGTPDFAVATLQNLVKNQCHIVGVITAPDKPAGRGRKLHKSAVKLYAETQNLQILQPTNLKSESFITQLKALKANLQIVVAFRMLPKVVWQMPAYGTFNLHASLLPNYRGAAPINWAIINGETQTGVTTFFIDEKIDTGEIILQEKIEIHPSENAGSLHDKLMQLGSDLVYKTVQIIAHKQVKTISQPKAETLKTAHKLNKDNCKINFNNSLNSIYNMVRGLSPYPTAWCYLQNNEETEAIKIYKANKELANHELEIGTLVTTKKQIKVAVKEGYLIIEEIKLPGKRKLNAASLLNGYHFNKNAKLL